MISRLLTLSAILFINIGVAQDYRWQQRVEYEMDVHLDVKTHKMDGRQRLRYYNNSSDTLTKVYYHLYFNAFQPGSMMDVRSRNIADPDARVIDRISKLKENEIGYQHIKTLKQDGVNTTYLINETILEVTLAKPLLPHSQTTFEMDFEAQVPVQVRRCGRDNNEGIAYSMTQWYPKLAEYDFRGWHAYPYVAREFHGVWGDFDVRITLDASFIIGGTGVLQNPEAIGYGYEKEGTKVKRKKGELTWHFVAKDVHDFAWAADPDFTHTKVTVPDGPELHFFYQKNNKTEDVWNKLPGYAVQHFQFMSSTYGKYPYSTYSIVQGGDRGMEYPMCTLISGERALASVVGTMAHEVSHSWYHGVLASNEILHHWMDEGFADFTSQESMNKMFNITDPPHNKTYAAYFAAIKNGVQEPSAEHADYYTTNRGYTTASYGMGCLFLAQLRYIMGDEHFYRGMRSYYALWQFRHPEPNDFVRVMEKESGLQLNWFYNYWINTTKHIDYGVESIETNGDKTTVSLKRYDELPMPVEFVVTLKDGTKEHYYIPLNEMLGSKPVERDRIDLAPWAWVAPLYKVELAHPKESISSIEIDPDNFMADVKKSNNILRLDNAAQEAQREQN